MPNIKTLKSRPRQKVIIKEAAHPGAIFKIACPSCKRSYAVQHINKDYYECPRCDSKFKSTRL